MTYQAFGMTIDPAGSLYPLYSPSDSRYRGMANQCFSEKYQIRRQGDTRTDWSDDFPPHCLLHYSRDYRKRRFIIKVW